MFAIRMTLNGIKGPGKYYRLALLLFSGVLVVVGWVIDIGGPGRGPAQLVVGAIGVVMIVVLALDKNGRFISRILLMLVATYCTLVGCELALRIARRPPPASWKQYHHLYRADPIVGYTLTPNWQGHFDDGYAHGNIVVNSLGQRDDEPSPTSKHRVLLLGDSFTFGVLLDQSETIDKQIEGLSRDIDAYNLGVGGYGLPSIIETLRRCDLTAHEAFYLFYGNDLQTGNLLPDNGKLVVDGHLVPQKRLDGTPYTEAEIRQMIGHTIEQQESKRAVVDLQLLLLPQIRELVNTVRKRPAASDNLQMTQVLGGDHSYSEENVRLAISHTEELRRLASSRGMQFYAVIIPTLQEVQAHEYSWPTAHYLKGIEDRNVRVVPLIQSLTEKDYFLHDGHFTRSGAHVAAAAINEILKPKQ